ncbi:MAG: deoxyribose-phosphate aldolase [Sphaerochaeta sp.]|nr:deoxyribose-phosphate aldolase [Sphaerochaeta sp.]
MDIQAFCHLIDHTLLKPQATKQEIATICLEARKHEFATVAIEPVYIPFAAQLLKGSMTGITSAIAYPHGCWSIDAKCREIESCLRYGASDCDYVIDLGALKEGNLKKIREEAKACRKATGSAILKVILEVALLTDEEIASVCTICAEEGADFVKTSTGYLGSPTLNQVELMVRSITGSSTHVKAAGGFSTLDRVEQALALGVTRIGTSSSIKLIQAWGEKAGET